MALQTELIGCKIFDFNTRSKIMTMPALARIAPIARAADALRCARAQ
jgi:hypothetical protein